MHVGFVVGISALALSTDVVLVPHALPRPRRQSVISPACGATVTSTDTPVRVPISTNTRPDATRMSARRRFTGVIVMSCQLCRTLVAHVGNLATLPPRAC